MNGYQIALLSWIGLAFLIAFGEAMSNIEAYPKPKPRPKPGVVAVGLVLRILILGALAALVVLA